VRNGETDAVDSTAAGAVAAFPEIALGHFFNNSDATLDRIGAGSAQISWSITGILRRSGQSWALTRSNRWTSSADITADAATELVDALFSLSEQNLEPIRFTGVHIDVSIEQAVHQYRIDKALWSKDGVHFANVRRLRVRPKHWIYARVLLADSNDGSSRTVNFRFLAPHRQLVGTIDISNAQDSAGSGSLGDCLFFDECSSSPGSDASNFQALLTGLADQPRNDDLLASSSFGPAEHKRSRRLDRVVTGSDSLEVLVGSASGGGGGPPSGFSFRAGHQ
jgi:hypothetical protein